MKGKSVLLIIISVIIGFAGGYIYLTSYSNDPNISLLNLTTSNMKK